MSLIKNKYCLSLCAACLILSGCISIPTSPTPRFYALSAVNGNRVSKKIEIASGLIIGVGPVKIPEYLDRPQMVTISQEKMLKFDEFDRWGESLDLGIARLIREDLTAMLPEANITMYPWNPLIAVKYQVVPELVQMDSQLDGDMHLIVQWSVIDLQNSKTVIIKRFDYRAIIVPQNYSGLAKALSSSCAALSSQIAQELAALK